MGIERLSNKRLLFLIKKDLLKEESKAKADWIICKRIDKIEEQISIQTKKIEKELLELREMREEKKRLKEVLK